MKQFFLTFVMVVAVITVLYAADCGIVGTWGFDMNGTQATVEYKQDGSFSQNMFGFTIAGTYTIKDNKLTTIVKDQKTSFTIVSCTPSSVTIKRDRDGMTVVYTKK